MEVSNMWKNISVYRRVRAKKRVRILHKSLGSSKKTYAHTHRERERERVYAQHNETGLRDYFSPTSTYISINSYSHGVFSWARPKKFSHVQ